ncbi:MAG: DNA gyrase modulator, partial [Terriglobia bacterium]
MKEIARWALDTANAHGATYADVRLVDLRQRYLSTKNGRPAQVRESQSIGVGVRVVAEGAWGFAATDDLARASIDRTAARAVEIARASATAKKRDVKLAKEPKIIDRWEAPCRIDPFSIPVSTCLELMLEVDAELRRVKGVTLAEASMDFRRIEQLFLSTAGSEIDQVKTQT